MMISVPRSQAPRRNEKKTRKLVPLTHPAASMPLAARTTSLLLANHAGATDTFGDTHTEGIRHHFEQDCCMTTPTKGIRSRAERGDETYLIAHRFGLLAALLLLMNGCQTSPALLSGCSPATANADRSRVLKRQILCDTGGEIVHHPFRAGRTILAAEAAWLGSAGRGLFGKRIGMCLHDTPPAFSPVRMDSMPP
jgi:hypothetical protein